MIDSLSIRLGFSEIRRNIPVPTRQNGQHDTADHLPDQRGIARADKADVTSEHQNRIQHHIREHSRQQSRHAVLDVPAQSQLIIQRDGVQTERNGNENDIQIFDGTSEERFRRVSSEQLRQRQEKNSGQHGEEHAGCRRKDHAERGENFRLPLFSRAEFFGHDIPRKNDSKKS